MSRKNGAAYIEECHRISQKRTDILEGALHRKLDLRNLDADCDRHFAIALPGSDGREENAEISSGFEAIFLSELPSQSEEGFGRLIQTRRRIEFCLMECLDTIGGDVIFELKDLKIHFDRLRFYFGEAQSSKIYFERLIDAKLIEGNAPLLIRAKQQLQLEVSSAMRQVKEVYKKRQKQYFNILKNNGQQRYKGDVIRHFDVDADGVVGHYNPDRNLYSFKYSHLRSVQFSVLLKILKVIDGNAEGLDFTTIPSHTMEKIAQLVDEGKIDMQQSSLSELYELYGYFLWLYHQSSLKYHKEQDCVFSVDQNEVDYFKDASKTLQKFCDLIKA